MSSNSSKKVLLGSGATFHGYVVEHDKFLADALMRRGATVEALMCGGALPACEVCTVTDYTPDRFLKKGPQGRHCKPCKSQGFHEYRRAGVTTHSYSDFLSIDDHKSAKSIVDGLGDMELPCFEMQGIRLGEEAHAGTLRFFTVGTLEEIPEANRVLRRYLIAAILSMRVSERALIQIAPDVVVFHHGIYVPLGILGQIARKLGIRVVNWALGYRKQCFVYSHNDTYHKTMIDEPVEAWRNTPLSAQEEARLMEYLDGRMTSKHDWIKHHTEPEDDPAAIREHLSLVDRPIILALTNVTWDAQLFYSSNAFPSIIDWLCHSIEAIGRRSDLQLVVRVHPSEIRGNMPTRQPIMSIVSKRIPVMPANVKVVPAESRISTYTLADMADATIIYGTKTGVELTCRGLPVIVCGEAWIRNKGLTIDVSSPSHYNDILDSLPLKKRIPPDQVDLARRYAYHYFFRRLIENPSLVPIATKESEKLEYRLVRKLKGLSGSTRMFKFEKAISKDQPYEPPEVEAICDGILLGNEFCCKGL